MFTGKRKSILLSLMLLLALLLAHPGVARASYDISGNVHYSVGGSVPNPLMRLRVYWGDGTYSQTGFTGNLNGSYSYSWETTGSLIGLDMELEAAQIVNNVKTWMGVETWTCGSMVETKNVIVYNQNGINADAKVAVHVLPHASRTCAKNFPTLTDCADIQTTEPAMDIDAFPVFFDLIEYQGFDYGLMWPGMSSCAFTSCSDLAIGTITWSGDGISHAWYACQAGPVAMCGWGWIYDEGMVCVSPHPSAGGPNIGDCSGDLNAVVCDFCAGIGGFIGDDPCEPTGTEPASWGSIKAMFK
jgi:hypothetical protein